MSVSPREGSRAKEAAVAVASTSVDAAEEASVDDINVQMAGAAISSATGSPDAFTAEELEAMRATKKLLILDGVPESDILGIELAVTVMNCKMRPEAAKEKYKEWLAMLAEFGVSSIEEAWGAAKKDGSGDWSAHERMFHAYQSCGRDAGNRSIFWIRGTDKGIPVEDEANSVKAGLIYFLAIHADLVTLRSGLTFVIDTSNNPTKPVGNERKMQKAWQAYPLRPQRIFIVGAGPIKRVFINSAIKFASLFAKSKVLNRISFATLETVKKEVPGESLPTYAGGKGGDIGDMGAWVRERIQSFPAVDI
jgi:hypothetical protein